MFRLVYSIRKSYSCSFNLGFFADEFPRERPESKLFRGAVHRSTKSRESSAHPIGTISLSRIDIQYSVTSVSSALQHSEVSAAFAHVGAGGVQQSASESVQSRRSAVATINYNGASTIAFPLLSLIVAVQLPHEALFYFLLACDDCIKHTSQSRFQKVQRTHKCRENLLLVMHYGSAEGATYIPFLKPAPDQSASIPPAVVPNVDINGSFDWFLVRPRPREMRSHTHDSFDGNYKLCWSVTAKSKCHRGVNEYFINFWVLK